jgi:SNF2 family DNA or RNA helicase
MMIEIESNWLYFEADQQQAKQLDAIWNAKRAKYKLPNTLGALRELHKAGYDVKDYGIEKANEQKRLLHRKNSEIVPMYSDKLRPYQLDDIYFLSSLPNAAIFNEQRTGKTPTTLKLIEAERHEKIIVICPASLVLNWEKEVKIWTDYEAISVKGTKKQREKLYQTWKSGFLILSKDTAKADVDLINTSGACIVVDEAHFLRNFRTAQSKAIFKLGKNASKRLALTGTPSVNGVHDVWGILHFLYPERFPSYWQFIDRYFKTWESPWGSKEIGKLKRKEELQEILELISVQRKRSEVMQWVPAKQYQTIELEMSKKQRKAYDEMLTTFTVEDVVDAPSVLAQLTRLRQICLAPESLGIGAPSAKEEFIKEWIDDNAGEPVIIFSNFSSYLRTLHGRIKGSRLIIGETSKPERQKTVEAFQAGKCNVILANIQAAGTGLTLDRAGTVIFLDRAYTPADNAQAEDRAIPTTKDSNQNTLIMDVVCKDSIDQKINDILQAKKSITEIVNNYRGIKELVPNV